MSYSKDYKNNSESKIIQDYINKIFIKDILKKYKICFGALYFILKRNNISNRGRKEIKITTKWRKNMSKSKLGEKNPMWKGNDVGYAKLHEWIRNHKLKPKLCEYCNKNKSYEVANISGKYKRDINDFEWLCRSCHMKKDGRLKKFNENRIKSRHSYTGIELICLNCKKFFYVTLYRQNAKFCCRKCYVIGKREGLIQ